MKRSALLLIPLLVANVTLGFVWLNRRAAPPTATTSVSTKGRPDWVANRAARLSASSVVPADGSASATIPSSTAAPEKFDWSRIHADDLKEYVARLRATGCPEETVQDIILAEVERRFSGHERSIWPAWDSSSDYWKAHPPYDAKVESGRNKRRRELRAEKTALLIELLGVDPRVARREASGLPAQPSDYADGGTSFLPEHKRAAVSDYLDKIGERMTEMQERNKGIWDAQTRAEQAALEQEQLRGLAQLLTPEEVRQWELRHSQLASQLQHDLQAMTLTEEDYKTIFDTRQKYGDSILADPDRQSKEDQVAIQAAKGSLTAELRAALGDTRTREYERAQDYQYQELYRLAKRNDLPIAAAAQVYDFKEASEASLKQLREDKTLTPQQRLAAQQAIYDETVKSVTAALGEKAFKSYQGSGGWWLRNLKPRPPATKK